MIQKRNIGLAILYSIITCGLYGMYWFVKITDEAIESAKSKEVAITFKLDDTNRNYKKLSAKMKTDGYNCSINY